MTSSKIFGVVREIEIVKGIPLYKRNSFTPAERIWLQENSEKEENDYREGYYAFTRKVQEELKLTTETEAYHLVKSYYRNNIDSKYDSSFADQIELLSLKNPLPNQADIRLKQLTYLINNRIVKEQFPSTEFLEAFGIAYEGVWTINHTRAADEILEDIENFLEREANKKNIEETNEEKKMN